MYAIRSYYVGHDGVRAGAQPGYEEILIFRARKLSEAVDYSPNTNKSPRFHIAGKSLPKETALAGLMGSEVTRITSYNVCYTKLLRDRSTPI